MKNSFLSLLAAFACTVVLASCQAFFPDRPQGRLSIRFSEDVFIGTRGLTDIPDTNDFLLRVSDSSGKEVYSGKYGDSPASFSLNPGSYTVSALSSEFKAPEFSAPQYGDRQVVVVSAGVDCSVDLICRQLNSGVKLNIAPSFLTAYPSGSLFLKSDDGRLPYSYSERRIAYFNPGSVSLILSDGGTDATLFTRILESQEILVLNVSAPSAPSLSGGGVRVTVDTTRYWTYEDYVIGQDGSRGADPANAYSVAQARASAGEEEVWVCGYIVGGDLSSSSASFAPPFKSMTNIVLGPRSSVTDRNVCLSVQLQKGNVRDALNLVDNPDVLGRFVFLKGDIVEAYYGIPGIRGITEFKLKDD